LSINEPKGYLEKQYNDILRLDQEIERFALGSMSNQVWHDDPKRLGFLLARYKFVARMLCGRARVLEIGCADAFGSRLVSKEVGQLVCSDFDTKFLEEIRAREEPWSFETFLWDPCEAPIEPNGFDAAYALDVLEHIDPSMEEAFLGNIGLSLTNNGILILGSPSLESQNYASAQSKAGHVNCKTEDDLRNSCKRFFETVFIFGMNDEVLTTGFGPMCHYRFAICVSPLSL